MRHDFDREGTRRRLGATGGTTDMYGGRISAIGVRSDEDGPLLEGCSRCRSQCRAAIECGLVDKFCTACHHKTYGTCASGRFETPAVSKYDGSTVTQAMICEALGIGVHEQTRYVQRVVKQSR